VKYSANFVSANFLQQWVTILGPWCIRRVVE